jgi:hypothetical protein
MEEEVQGKPLQIIVHDQEDKDEEANFEESENTDETVSSSSWWQKRYTWWLHMAIFSFLVLSGQSVATLLGRAYYDKGGNSKWLATLVQTVGFPILIPLTFCFSSSKNLVNNQNPETKPASLLVLISLYAFLGIFLAADCMLYSIGLLYLPVSTYSLICASQLAFNALFSYFLNSQKFTPYIANSLVLLTISSVLLVFQPDSTNSRIPKGKYVIGFLCTVGASAGYALMLSVTQLSFRKILKKETYKVVIDMLIYQSAVATFVIVIGLFASGEWKGLTKEMTGYKSGKVSYLMNLIWTAVSWQLFGIGCVGLIFKVSSLFSNVISTLGLPIVPVLAVVFFKDKMSGIKVISMILAIWGFASYIYQHYLDDLESKAAVKNAQASQHTE